MNENTTLWVVWNDADQGPCATFHPAHEVAEYMNMDLDEIFWAIEEHGRCDTISAIGEDVVIIREPGDAR